MKKLKLISIYLCTALLAVNLTACSAGKTDSDSAVDIGDLGEVTGMLEVEEILENETDNKADNANAANLEPEVFSDAPLVNYGMGIENGVYFVTPLSNGKPLDIAAMEEVSLVTDTYEVSTGATINIAALTADYIVGELDGESVYLGSGSFNYDENLYEQELEIYLEHMEFYEEDYSDSEVYEVVDDVTFYYEYGDLFAVKKINNASFMCIGLYSSDGFDEATLQKVKTEMLDIYANTTFAENVEREFASAYKFDAISFDCGWCIADITYVDWNADYITVEYDHDDRDVDLRIYFEKLSGTDMARAIESADAEVYEGLTDETGNRIGYIDTYTRDNDAMRYCIRSEDGSYMDVDIHAYSGSGSIDFHNWSEIEALLNSGN